MPQHKGFTLIELSIVLVIIGLIVGGVLVGRDLITSASLRSQIAQIDKIQTAVTTFQGKFGALPGDIDEATAGKFGFTAPAWSRGGDGDKIVSNNGFIEGTEEPCFDGCGSNGPGNYETAYFWDDLSSAAGGRLIQEGNFKKIFSPTTDQCELILNASNASECEPKAKIGDSNYLTIYNNGHSPLPNIPAGNWLQLSKILNDGTINIPYFHEALTTKQAYDIDKKIDDGIPIKGNVTSGYMDDVGMVIGGAYGEATDPVIYPCAHNNNVAGAPVVYDLTNSKANQFNCGLSFRIK